MRPLIFITDGFGAKGGIARYNQQLIDALRTCLGVERVRVIARFGGTPDPTLKGFMDYRECSRFGLIEFLAEGFRHIFVLNNAGLVICGHIHLLPVAATVAAIHGLPLLLILHGIDGWTAPTNILTRSLVKQCAKVLCVSSVTRNRFLNWSGMDPFKVVVILNAINLDAYSPGDKPEYLLARYGIKDAKIILTMGRIDTRERSKGFDQVLDVLPRILDMDNSIRYIVVGDGTDRPRLEAKTRRLNLTDKVIFSGWIDEAEKIDHFRLADAYVMPSHMEGFGYVLVEALACGIPVVGSRIDGSVDALDHGKLGELVNPDDLGNLVDAIMRALAKPKCVPAGIHKFSIDRYQHALRELISEMVAPMRANRD